VPAEKRAMKSWSWAIFLAPLVVRLDAGADLRLGEHPSS
jgi:hypothetical protein